MIAVGVLLMNLGTPMTMYPAALESALTAFCTVSYSHTSHYIHTRKYSQLIAQMPIYIVILYSNYVQNDVNVSVLTYLDSINVSTISFFVWYVNISVVYTVAGTIVAIPHWVFPEPVYHLC